MKDPSPRLFPQTAARQPRRRQGATDVKRITRLLLPILLLPIAHHVAAAQSIGPHTIKGTVNVRVERPLHIEVVLENGTRMPLSRLAGS